MLTNDPSLPWEVEVLRDQVRTQALELGAGAAQAADMADWIVAAYRIGLTDVAQQGFQWEQKLSELRRDAYDEIERATCNTDLKLGASRGTDVLARMVFRELSALIEGRANIAKDGPGS